MWRGQYSGDGPTGTLPIGGSFGSLTTSECVLVCSQDGDRQQIGGEGNLESCAESLRVLTGHADFAALHPLRQRALFNSDFGARAHSTMAESRAFAFAGDGVATPPATASTSSAGYDANGSQTFVVKSEHGAPLLQSPSASSATPKSGIRPTSTGSQFAGIKRAHDGVDDSDSADMGDGSPTGVSWAAGQESRIGVKRACNECRQQKLKCNVQQDPWKACDRCLKQKIHCRIDANFKRVGKRKKNAEMEQENSALHQQIESRDDEILILKQQVQALQGNSAISTFASSSNHLAVPGSRDIKYPVPRRKSAVNDMIEVGAIAETMMDMRNLGSPGPSSRVYNLGGFSIGADQVDDLFAIFFSFYHPFLPLMNEKRGPAFFHQECPLLFWVIMATAMRKYAPNPGLLFSLDEPLRKMLWSTISDVKQHYLVVKALATLCTWPLPVSASNADPTTMLCGIMVQLAKTIGLHRPSHAQDFERFKVDLRQDELRDRYYTWAACNIVAQRVSTGYGLPPNTMYDWTLTSGEGREASFSLHEDVEARLQVEMFSNEVSRELYGWRLDPLGIASPERKREVTTQLDELLGQLERDLGSASTINRLYLYAARLHYHLSALFDSPTKIEDKEYLHDLSKLWDSTEKFVNAAVHITSPSGESGPIIIYATNYIFQMLLASGFVLLKLLNSFYAIHVDREKGRHLFSQVVDNLRTMGIMSNDLPSRFGEVLVQLWNNSGRGTMPVSDVVDDSLQLKVRSRMSMSLIHDSVWRWRALSQAETSADARDAALNQTTNPDTDPANVTQSLAPPVYSMGGGPNSTLAPPAGLGLRRSPTPVGADRGWGDNYLNDVFDPASWLLSGQLPDFPIDFTTDPFTMGLSSI